MLGAGILLDFVPVLAWKLILAAAMLLGFAAFTWLRTFDETDRRFVQKQDLRLMQQGACDHEALLLSPGEFLDLGLGFVADVELLEQRHRAALGLAGCAGAFNSWWFLIALPMGTASAAVTYIFPNQFRGFVAALYLFVLNGLGLPIGNYLPGYLNTHFFNEQALGTSAAIT